MEEIGAYTLLFPIGSGESSTVYAGLSKATSIPVAIKIIDLNVYIKKYQIHSQNENVFTNNSRHDCQYNYNNNNDDILYYSQSNSCNNSFDNDNKHYDNNHSYNSCKRCNNNRNIKNLVDDNNNNNSRANCVHNDNNNSNCFNHENVLYGGPMKFIDREIKIMKMCDHHNITMLFDVVEKKESNEIVLVTEFCSNGSLASKIILGAQTNANYLVRYISQIADAISYLHNELNVVHRDLKAENVLLDDYFNIRISDFGISTIVDGVDGMMNTRCGSPMYTSPEVILGEPYSKKTDIWSLGVLYYLLATGTFPFRDENGNIMNLMEKIVNEPITFSKAIEIDLKELICKMLEKEPTKRISIDEVRNSAYILNNMLKKVGNSCTSPLFKKNINSSSVSSTPLARPPLFLNKGLSSATPLSVANNSLYGFHSTSSTPSVELDFDLDFDLCENSGIARHEVDRMMCGKTEKCPVVRMLIWKARNEQHHKTITATMSAMGRIPIKKYNGCFCGGIPKEMSTPIRRAKIVKMKRTIQETFRNNAAERIGEI